MPTVQIKDVNKQTSKEIEYSFGTESLESIIKKIDPTAEPNNTWVAVDKHLFKNWKPNISACLMYGHKISVYRYAFNFKFRFDENQHEIESFNLKKTVAELKSEVEKLVRVVFMNVDLKIGNIQLTDDKRELISYGIRNHSVLVIGNYILSQG